MKIPALRVVVVLVALSGWGCRQPDGVVPAIDEENANRIGDAATDLRRGAHGDVEAQRGFADDLLVFPDEHNSAALDATRGFADRLSEAVVSSSLDEATAEQIARICWNLIGVTELSDRQVKALQDELRGQLVAAGLAQDRVDALVAEMPAVQRAVTTRPRRWYHVF